MHKLCHKECKLPVYSSYKTMYLSKMVLLDNFFDPESATNELVDANFRCYMALFGKAAGDLDETLP